MNKNLLIKSIEELEGIKQNKLKEAENATVGLTKLANLVDGTEKRKKELENELIEKELILANKEQEKTEWNKRIEKIKVEHNDKVYDLNIIKKEIQEYKKEAEKNRKELGDLEKQIEKLEGAKFTIAKLKEINKQMFDEMKDIYRRAGNDFPYDGSYDEYISKQLNAELN